MKVFKKLHSKSGHFFVFQKKAIILFLVLILMLSCFAFLPSVFATTPTGLFTIVIDAGHGGIDPGCKGTQKGSNERELNLKYAQTLQKYLKNYGINVVMTRTTTDGLYSAFASNKKKDDMEKRKEIIERSHADVIISIHMNSFSLTSCRGAQAFYNPNSEVSSNLARAIQDSFVANLVKARQNPDVGDYYMLNCTNVPAVIIECGFLSNPEEEILLLSDDYRERVCYAILCGIIKYLD